jgi:phosphoenolpyruvate-protein kinase (PTS system EI component)
MASDPRYIFILLGFGFNQLSMVSSMVPWIKKITRSCRYEETKELVKVLLASNRCDHNEDVLSRWIKERFPEDFQKNILHAV